MWLRVGQADFSWTISDGTLKTSTGNEFPIRVTDNGFEYDNNGKTRTVHIIGHAMMTGGELVHENGVRYKRVAQVRKSCEDNRI